MKFISQVKKNNNKMTTTVDHKGLICLCESWENSWGVVKIIQLPKNFHCINLRSLRCCLEGVGYHPVELWETLFELADYDQFGQQVQKSA